VSATTFFRNVKDEITCMPPLLERVNSTVQTALSPAARLIGQTSALRARLPAQSSIARRLCEMDRD